MDRLQDGKEHIGMQLKDLAAEKDHNTGAYICEKDIFYRICHLERRRSRARNINTWLVDLSFESDEDDDESLNTARVNLMMVMLRRLRSGDVVCRWSEDKYAALLYDIDDEDNVERVIHRIKDYFSAGPYICSRKDCWYNEEGECELDKIVQDGHAMCQYAESPGELKLTYDYHALQ